MLKAFKSLLIQKFTVSAQGTSWENFFPAHYTCANFFLGGWSCAEIFFLGTFSCRTFFRKSPTPLPLKVKWFAPYSHKLSVQNITAVINRSKPFVVLLETCLASSPKSSSFIFFLKEDAFSKIFFLWPGKLTPISRSSSSVMAAMTSRSS